MKAILGDDIFVPTLHVLLLSFGYVGRSRLPTITNCTRSPSTLSTVISMDNSIPDPKNSHHPMIQCITARGQAVVPPFDQARAGGGDAVARAQGGRLPRQNGRAHPRQLRNHISRREQGLILIRVAPIGGIHLVRLHQGGRGTGS